LSCYKETAESCELRYDVFETQGKRLQPRELRFYLDQLVSSTPR